MDWYGLKVNGEMIAVIRWADRLGEPTVFDFNIPMFGSDYYEIVPVFIEEAPR